MTSGAHTRGDPPEVSILIVSFNTRQMTIECLDSIQSETDIAHEVIVIDNNSSDGSADAIAKRFPNAKLLESDENIGFARANNVAAKEAIGYYLLLLNPDTVILDGAIDKLCTFARDHPTAKIWGGRTVYADGSLNDTCCFQQMTPWTIFCRLTGLSSLFSNHESVSEKFGHWQMESVRQVDIITGCFMLIPRSLWENLGGFDPRYFMYGEEADLCLRAAKSADAKPLFTPDAQIVHHGGASETVRENKQVRLLAAKITLIIDHFRPATIGISKAMYVLIPATRLVALRLLGVWSDRASQEADEWASIWRRRSEWRKGYASSEATPL